MKSFHKEFLLIVLLLTGCKENTPVESRNEKIEYKGITRTSESGQLIGNVDFDDWLMLGDGESYETHYSVYPAYPNPTAGSISLDVNLPRRDSLVIWIDDAPKGEIKFVTKRFLDKGLYRFDIILKDTVTNLTRPEGLIRIFVDFPLNDEINLIHGDVEFFNIISGG